MSNMDRAPEPTMEEILASIRRIISDEESKPATDREPAARREPKVEARPEPRAGQRPEPSRAAPPPEPRSVPNAAPAAGPLPGQPEPGSPAEEEVEAIARSLGASEEDVAAAPELAAAPEPEFPIELPEDEILDLDDSGLPEVIELPEAADLEDDAPGEEEELLELGSDFTFAFEEEIDTVEEQPVTQGKSALDDAIAALRGERRESGPEMQSAEEEDDEVEVLLDLADLDAGESEADFDDDDIIAENAEAFSEAIAAAPPVHRNGMAKEHELAGFAAGGATMEETVKEMLRPMLRQWLDQNMSRVLEEALKDELGSQARQRKN